MSEPESEDVVARSRLLREAINWESGVDSPLSGRAERNAALIAATPTLLAELEAEVERLRGRLDEARARRTIHVTLRPDREHPFHACIMGERGMWEVGDSYTDAIGKVVANHGGSFGFRVEMHVETEASA
jgi:hypothetical protein